uniref:uncharacterized protein LOC122583367 n=1 Tax=Erigeron canadensis TaxID=72917 RepID=UPI001CB98145|nr:uncharacterized protein LOC122583367 [Erigeron canadensis]
MPPRRRNVNDVHEQDLEERITKRLKGRLEEQLDQFADDLINQMNALMNQRGRHNRNYHEEEDENLFGGGSDCSFSDEDPQPNQRGNNNRWEFGIRTTIPEFDGDTLSPEIFIYWLAVVEEVFEFKGVPEDKKVSLIATRLCGRASAWWQQLKLTRMRVGKSKVRTWEKMKKCMRADFIPHNYQRLMYQWLQNLKQGSKSVEDYTTEFYQLIARNDIQETEEQLVSRYIGGLRVQIMEFVNMFDPVKLSEAHQRALAYEKQNRRVGGSSSAMTGGSSVSKGASSSGLKCFNCGESGHRQSECKKPGKRHLFVDPDDGGDDEEANGDYEEAPVFDEEPECDEEEVAGDVGVNLVVRRSCYTPKANEDDWLKHNIFHSTCTVLGKVCSFVVDPGSCDNLVSDEAVKKLALKTENHPKPYKLQWLKKGGEDDVWCDVVPMDACHLLLGRPWEYDCDVEHIGRKNTYSFLFNNVKITLLPSKPKVVATKPTGTLLTRSQFEDELEEDDDIYVLIGKC